MKDFSLLYFILLSVLLFFLPQTNLVAQENPQTNQKRGVIVSFQNKKTEQNNKDLASNVIIIKNHTSSEVTFTLSVSAPGGWKLLSKNNRQYQISSEDSLFIPVNIIPQNVTGGNTNHIVNAALLAENGTQFASSIWYIGITKESNWIATLEGKKTFFLNGADTTHFKLRIENTGNTDEKLRVQFLADRRVEVIDPVTLSEIPFINISLGINKDTTITCFVRKKHYVNQSFRDFDARTRPVQSEIIPLRVVISDDLENNGQSRTWRSTVDLITSLKELKYKEHAAATIPLTIDASIDNIVDNATVLNIGFFGNTELGKQRFLDYRFQTFFTSNFYDYRSYLGNSHYIGYTSPSTTIELGDISGFPNFNFSTTGRGLKVQQRLNANQMMGAFFSEGYRTFNSISSNFNTGVVHQLSSKGNSLQNAYMYSQSSLLNTSTQQYANNLRLRIARSHNLSLGTSFSYEEHQSNGERSLQSGYSYSINYSGNFRKLNMHFVHTYGSPYNLSYRGVKTFGGNLLYALNNRRSLRASYTFYEYNPRYTSSSGIILNPRGSSMERYQLGYSFNPQTYSLSFQLYHLYTDVFNLRSEANGVGIDYRPVSKTDLRFYLSSTGEYIKMLDYNLPLYFASQTRASLRYRNFNTALRYYYGPYQSYQQLLFAQTRVNSQSIFSNNSVRMWIKKDLVSFEPSFLWSYETLFRRTRVSFRPEFYYLPKNGMELRFYGQYISNNQKENPFLDLDQREFGLVPPVISNSNLFFGLGVKKKIGIPVSAKRYNNLTIITFRDLNGNGKQDKNELGLKNVLVNVKVLNADTSNYSSSRLKEIGENFITDASGTVVYKNLPKGIYKISITPLSNVSGFFAGNDQEVMIDKNLTYAMPLNQGVTLSGALFVEHDPSLGELAKALDISKIRITAIDSAGNSYSTITDPAGRFNMKLPAGNYRVSINENALPANYEVDNKKVFIEMLTISENYTVTFVAREKKRKINIKKFDEQGKVKN